MHRYKLTIAYDGTHYGGWQVQPNAISIQTLIELALSTLLKEKVNVVGSGRTDSGVHALAQIAHFECSEDLKLSALQHSLNGLLPRDIRIHSAEKVDSSFHARFSARGKIYRYHLDLGRAASPFTRLYSLHLSYPIDRKLLKEAAKKFVGTHDFTSFSNEAHKGSASRDPIRTIERLDVLEEGDAMILEFEGDGFLYKMVRNCVGTLLDIARDKIELSELGNIFKACDRKKAGSCAPAQGLFLVKVLYP